MASNALTPKPSPLESSDRSSSDFFELRRPDGNVIDLSLRSDRLMGAMPSSSYNGSTRSPPRRNSGNNLSLDLSARSDTYVPTDTKRRPSERVYVNSNGHQRTAAAPTRSQPRRNSGNDLPLKLSSSSDPHETNDMKRRSSERVYVERQQIAAARRTSSKPNTANFNGKFLDNLPESSAVLNFNRRPGNHVNNTVPQSSSLNQGDISGRSTQVMSGSFQCLFKD